MMAHTMLGIYVKSNIDRLEFESYMNGVREDAFTMAQLGDIEEPLLRHPDSMQDDEREDWEMIERSFEAGNQPFDDKFEWGGRK
jgi:hypothetical protein